MNTSKILKTLVVVYGFWFSSSAIAAEAAKPNIVLFVADDMGFADAGVYGGKDIPTPTIDSLAAGGVRFLNGYTSGCVCSPTRAALLTGRYQQRFGFEANAEGKPQPTDRDVRGLDLKQVTFAQRFKKLGYATGIFGKWHLGTKEGYHPTERGFDEFYGILPFGIGWSIRPDKPDVFRNMKVVEKPANHMEQFCTEALSFIDKHHEKPFLLYLPFTAVHDPFVGPQPYLDRMDAKMSAERRRYAADLSQMDDVMGRVMARLRKHNLEENTLIFFFSDNGGSGGVVNNGPLKGTKWTLWEGGIHVPFIVQWKGRIPAGRVLEHPVIQVDVLPTALAAAKVAIDPEWKLDGVNLLTYMEGKTSKPPHDALYWRFGIQYAVRQGPWKLVKAHLRDFPHLYNLDKDPGEKNNLAEQEPEMVQSLQTLWDMWNSDNLPPAWVDERWDGDGPRPQKVDKPAVAQPGQADN